MKSPDIDVMGAVAKISLNFEHVIHRRERLMMIIRKLKENGIDIKYFSFMNSCIALWNEEYSYYPVRYSDLENGIFEREYRKV